MRMGRDDSQPLPETFFASPAPPKTLHLGNVEEV
jgi:hypothetical protein